MNLGFIGCGKMASALVEGVLSAGIFSAEQIFVSDRFEQAVAALVEKCGVQPSANNAEVAAKADALLLCVKPGDVAAALQEMRGTRDKLVISIAAGVTLQTLQKHAGEGTRCVRVMPNTPALVHKGAAAYALGASATEADAALTERIFSSVGFVARVEEKLLDAVTGLSGSGPAYIYVVIEALAKAGAEQGLPQELALKLAAQTVNGAASMVLQTSISPDELKRAVMSPGGTTVAGLEALETSGVRAAFSNAVRVATERSRELGAEK